jgi:hypothetical protein
MDIYACCSIAKMKLASRCTLFDLVLARGLSAHNVVLARCVLLLVIECANQLHAN